MVAVWMLFVSRAGRVTSQTTLHAFDLFNVFIVCAMTLSVRFRLCRTGSRRRWRMRRSTRRATWSRHVSCGVISLRLTSSTGDACTDRLFAGTNRFVSSTRWTERRRRDEPFHQFVRRSIRNRFAVERSTEGLKSSLRRRGRAGPSRRRPVPVAQFAVGPT